MPLSHTSLHKLRQITCHFNYYMAGCQTCQVFCKNSYYAYDSYVKESETRLQSSYAMVKRNLETAELKNERNYDREAHVPKYEVGSVV
jgi:hypothetical protein